MQGYNQYYSFCASVFGWLRVFWDVRMKPVSDSPGVNRAIFLAQFTLVVWLIAGGAVALVYLSELVQMWMK